METNKLTGIDEAVEEIAKLRWSYTSAEQFKSAVRGVIVKHCIGRDMQVHQSEAFIRCCHFLSKEVASLKQRIRNQAETIQSYQTNPEAPQPTVLGYTREDIALLEATITDLRKKLSILRAACNPIVDWQGKRKTIVDTLSEAMKLTQ